MFGSIIGRRVWKAIKAKIAAAQRRYDEGCKQYDEDRNEQIRVAEARCEQRKADLADELVAVIIN